MSVVVPVYGNEASIPTLLERFRSLAPELPGFEAVFVVDGSPDASLALLRGLLPEQPFQSQLVAHARNWGSFAAIRTGLQRATGDVCAVLAADLQEPPELLVDFWGALADGGADVAIGVRRSRADSWRHAFPSRVFWGLYRRLVQKDVPSGGVDIFACTAAFRDRLVALAESNSSLVGLVMWLGHRRVEVPYDRAQRAAEHGRSGWTFKRRFRYLSDSVFAFSDLPIRVLSGVGAFGVVVSLLTSLFVVIARLFDVITVPGYAATILAISFFGALNLFAMGIIGSYLWRTFENTKQRPGAVVMDEWRYPG